MCGRISADQSWVPIYPYHEPLLLSSQKPLRGITLQCFPPIENIRTDRLKNKNKPGHFTLSLMVLYDISENNWEGSTDIWHVNKAVSNYGGMFVFKAGQTLGCPYMCFSLRILAQDLAASSRLFKAHRVDPPLPFSPLT